MIARWSTTDTWSTTAIVTLFENGLKQNFLRIKFRLHPTKRTSRIKTITCRQDSTHVSAEDLSTPAARPAARRGVRA